MSMAHLQSCMLRARDQLSEVFVLVEPRTFRRLGSAAKADTAEASSKTDEGKPEQEQPYPPSAAQDKPARKRKWGSSQSKTTASKSRTSSLEISTDSLKGLIEDVRVPVEPVLELEEEAAETMFLEPDAEQDKDKRDVKIKRTVVMREGDEPRPTDDTRRVETVEDSRDAKRHSDDENEPPPIKKKSTEKRSKEQRKEHVKDIKIKKEVLSPESDKKQAEPIKETRRISQPLVPADEPEAPSRELSPPRKPVNNIVHIINLVRPFTLGQLKQLLSRTGTLVDSGFWINSIKSHCYVTYESEEHAVETRKALHGARWPQSNPKTLRVDYASKEEMDRRRAEEEGGPAPPRPQPAPQPKAPSPPPTRDRRASATEPDRKREERPVREWDRGKRSRTPDRGPTTGRARSRSRERPRDKERERERERRHREQENNRSKERKEKKVEPAKVEEEPPAKLLDDLFRKTKATPCIYWLPLTEEAYQERIRVRRIARAEREKLLEQKAEETNRRRVSDNYRRDGTSSQSRERSERDRQREREDGSRQRERDRDREKERERPRDRERDRSRDEDRDKRRGSRDRSSRDRSSRQEKSKSRSKSRDRRRR